MLAEIHLRPAPVIVSPKLGLAAGSSADNSASTSLITCVTEVRFLLLTCVPLYNLSDVVENMKASDAS